MSANILKEYLVALGFKVNTDEAKKAEDTNTRMLAGATRLGHAIGAVATAAKAMVTVYAYQMEKLYYASKRTDSAVGAIQSLEFGAKQIGISGDAIRGSLEGMARALRANPGLQGLLESLGVQVTGRDKSDVMLDLVAALQKMPHYVAQQYAAMFGIDADSLYLMTQNLDKLREAKALREQMARDSGLDLDKASEAGLKYAQTLRSIWERVGLLKDAMSVQLLPAFQAVAAMVERSLEFWTKYLNGMERLEDFARRFKEGVFGSSRQGVTLTPEAQARIGAGETKQIDNSIAARIGKWWEGSALNWTKNGSKAPGGPQNGPQTRQDQPGGDKSPGVKGSPQQDLFGSLERKYALPPGWLDKVWKKESNRGDPRFMKSHAGAEGHFQFMPTTAKEYGLNDPYDLKQSAEAAAKYFSRLMKKYNGDMVMAAAAYNWGQGNLDRKGLGAAPAETRDYVKSLTGTTIEQTNNITITGVKDPVAVAAKVQDANRQTNADLIRHLQPRIQ